MQNMLAEIRSWWNWFLNYRLPCWLSIPFRVGFFKFIYTLLTGVLLLVFIPAGLFKEAIRQTLSDYWIDKFGQNSLAAWNAWLNVVSSAWGTLVLALLLSWGLLVLFWGWKKLKFFDKLDDFGINILRGPGERRAF